MPAVDLRLNEIARLKNKILEVESQLKEEKKISAKLRGNSEKKIHQLSLIDDAIAAEMESFRWKKEKIIFAQTSFEEECLQKLKSLKYKENQIKEEIAGFEVVEFENEKLHSRLKEISTEQLINAKAQSKEREARKQKNFDTRMKMEEILRKTIKNFDNNYQQEAISKMDQEALQANAENNRIHTEFDLREQKTENLIRQQQTSYEQLMRLRIERDVVAVSAEIQERNIATLVVQNEKEQLEIAELSKTVDALRQELAQLQEAAEYKAAVETQLSTLRHEVQRAVRQRKKLLNAAIRVSHKVLYEGMDIAEKVRAFRSCQIAQRIGQIGRLSIGDSATPVDDMENQCGVGECSDCPPHDSEHDAALPQEERLTPLALPSAAAHWDSVQSAAKEREWDPASVWKVPGGAYQGDARRIAAAGVHRRSTAKPVSNDISALDPTKRHGGQTS